MFLVRWFPCCFLPALIPEENLWAEVAAHFCTVWESFLSISLPVLSLSSYATGLVTEETLLPLHRYQKLQYWILV